MTPTKHEKEIDQKQELHALPGNWTWVPLADICDADNGRAFKSTEWRDNGVPIIRIQNLKDPVASFNYYQGDLDQKHRVKGGDLLFAWSGTPGTSFGAHIWRGPDAALNQHIFNVRFDPTQIDPKYFCYALNQNVVRYVAQAQGGVGLAHITKSKFMASKVPLAPPEQQKRIVAEIEKQFSRLDDAVVNLKRIKTNLKRYKAAVLKAAAEGKLTEDWRKAHPDVEPASKLLARILTERRAKWSGKGKYKEPSLPPGDNVSVQPAVPETWEFVGMDQVLPPTREAMKTGPFGSLLKKHEHRTEGIPVLGIENIETMRFVRGSKIYITKTKAEDLVGYRVMPHDVLISRSGTVGEVCVVPNDIGEARMSTNLLKLSLISGGMLPEFFVLLFNGSPFILKQVSNLCKGSTRNFLNQEILKQLLFVLPPMLEQQQIVSEVERHLSVIDELEANVEANLTRAHRLRHSILRKAFTSDLSDNPVSVS